MAPMCRVARASRCNAAGDRKEIPAIKPEARGFEPAPKICHGFRWQASQSNVRFGSQPLHTGKSGERTSGVCLVEHLFSRLCAYAPDGFLAGMAYPWGFASVSCPAMAWITGINWLTSSIT